MTEWTPPSFDNDPDFTLRYGTWDAVDHQGDVIIKGAIKEGLVLPMTENHDWSRIVAVGRTFDADEGPMVDAFFLPSVSEEKRNDIRTLAHFGKQEGSISFSNPKALYGADIPPKYLKQNAKRYISGVEPIEIALVLKGAQPGTKVVSMKRSELIEQAVRIEAELKQFSEALRNASSIGNIEKGAVVDIMRTSKELSEFMGILSFEEVDELDRLLDVGVNLNETILDNELRSVFEGGV